MIGESLKKLRLSKKLTLEKLAELLNTRYPGTVNFNKGKLSKWENEKEEPKLSSIRIMADFYNISIDDLYSGNLNNINVPTTLSQINETSEKLEEKRQVVVLNVATKELQEQVQEQKQQKVTSLEQHRQKRQQQQELGEIDWCGAVSAGTGEFLGDENSEKINLPIEMIPDGADFCLSVNGDSMEPVFKNDSYVFVEKQRDLYSGAIGVVIVNSQAFLKRIWFENNHARLESFNKEYEDIIVTEEADFRIIGKVVM